MRKKTNARTVICLLLTALLLLTGYLALTWRAIELDFVELSSPNGFRELILEGQVSPTAQFLTVSPNVLESDTVAAKLDPRELCASLFYDASSPTVGSEHSAVALVTFFDYRCPYCRTLTKILSRLQDDGNIQIIYKEWPILGESSILAARAALAAAKQGQYTTFHMRLMESRFVPTPAYIEALANELKLDLSQLLEDMSGADISAAIQRSAVLASEFNFAGTPALIVGRTVIRGAVTRFQLEKLIADEAAFGSKRVCSQPSALQNLPSHTAG